MSNKRNMARAPNTRRGRTLSTMPNSPRQPNMSVWQFDQQGDHASRFMLIRVTTLASEPGHISLNKLFLRKAIMQGFYIYLYYYFLDRTILCV